MPRKIGAGPFGGGAEATSASVLPMAVMQEALSCDIPSLLSEPSRAAQAAAFWLRTATLYWQLNLVSEMRKPSTPSHNATSLVRTAMSVRHCIFGGFSSCTIFPLKFEMKSEPAMPSHIDLSLRNTATALMHSSWLTFLMAAQTVLATGTRAIHTLPTAAPSVRKSVTTIARKVFIWRKHTLSARRLKSAPSDRVRGYADPVNCVIISAICVFPRRLASLRAPLWARPARSPCA